jgi:SSS family solute:Na+ symporter
MESSWIIIAMVVFYIIALAFVSIRVRKAGKTSEGFIRGGKTFPAIIIGMFLASEVIGTSASIGTAQGAFKSGISAAWNIGALGIGFVLFAIFLARKFKNLDELTISGALERAYGGKVRRATSITMIASLLLVATAAYKSGGAMLSELFHIGPEWAVVIVGSLASVYVGIGGMKSVIYTNIVNIVVKIIGIIIVAAFAYQAAGGFDGIRVALPPKMLAWDGVGWAQIGAWLIAGGGAMFSTQYVVQSITAVGNEAKARRASFYTSIILIPYGFLAALIGVSAAVVHPGIKSINALPSMVIDMNPFLAGVAVTGLTASVFGLISALTIGASTLLLKDFYQPYFNKANNERKSIVFARAATIVCGMLPVMLALFAANVLEVTFLAKALRASLAVFVVLMFYKPGFGTRQGAVVSIWCSLGTTIAWYLAGNPFGIDNAYVAIATPVLVMSVTHFLRLGDKPSAPSAKSISSMDRQATHASIQH